MSDLSLECRQLSSVSHPIFHSVMLATVVAAILSIQDSVRPCVLNVQSFTSFLWMRVCVASLLPSLFGNNYCP